VLPVPMYARVLSVEAGDARRSSGGGQTLLQVPSEREITYTVAQGRAPDFRYDGPPIAAPRALLEPTVPDEELPAEVHRFLDGLRESPSSGLDRASAVRDFVRARYRYDGQALEDPGFARRLRDETRGRRHRQIAMLHARRDPRHLGAGVCFELGALTTELLRRSGVPAAVCTGWTFDRGALSEPDHLWSLALLPTTLGLRWMPIDASTTREGRPLHTGPRPAGPWTVPEVPASAGAGLDAEEALARCREMLADPEKAARLIAWLGDQR